VKKAILILCALPILVLAYATSVTIGEYPDLNSCFKTTASKQLLCKKNPDYTSLVDVSDYFLKAVVMSEDDKFYSHRGFDWAEFKNSVAANLREFAFVRGGSTITQQLVKNAFLNRDKTITRKIIEAKLAKKIESRNTKKLILEKYVNAIEFGKNLWGINQASRFYFDKPPAYLTPLESLYLVILLPSPVRYSKTFFDKKLSSYQKKRMKTLLKRMKRRGVVGKLEFERSMSDLETFLNPNSEVETLEISPEDFEPSGSEFNYESEEDDDPASEIDELEGENLEDL